MRWKWILGTGLFLIIVLMAAVYVFLNTYDYNNLKPRIARMVKEATGRELRLGGAINLAIGLSPALVITDITFANPSWGSQPQMIRVDELHAQVRLLPLLARAVELRRVGLKGVDVLLETNPNGEGNWEFPVDDSSASSAAVIKPAEIDIDKINIENLHLIFRQHQTGSETRLALASLDAARQEADNALKFNLRADYNGQPVELGGELGLIRRLFAHERFPLKLSGKFSNAAVKIDGAIVDVLDLEGIDLMAQASGTNLEELGRGMGIKLPKTNAFDVTGQLKGSKEALALEGLRGNLSASAVDLSVSGSFGDLIAISGIDLKLRGSGKDLEEAGAIFDRKLPATDAFSVQGRLTGSAKALSLQAAQGSARRGDLDLALEGGIQDLISLKGIDLKVRASGKDLAEIGTIIDQKLPATDQFAVQARLTGSKEALSLQGAQGSARRGSLNLTLNGGVEALSALKGINLMLKASGRELAEIGPLVGAGLPELGPFDVSATLSGSAEAISLNQFSAFIDKSDFNGLAKVEFLKHPKITVRLESSVIDFTALMKSSEKDEQKTVNAEKQKRRLFSNNPLPFDAFKKVDADILIKARNIHAKDARLEFGYLTLKLDGGDFSIDRIEATYKQTKISGNLHIDSSSPPQVATKFIVQGFDLGGLLKETGVSDQVRANLDIAAHLKSRGDSVHSLMADLDGSIGAIMGEGYLTEYLNLISLNLSQKARQFWGYHPKGDQIKCAVVQFDIQKGIADSRAFVFDTQAGILTGEGKINLGTEQVDFLLVPQPRDPSLLELSTKLRVSGSILDAVVRPDSLALLTRGVRALGALAIGPIGLLAPFVNLGAHAKHPCDIRTMGQLEQRISTDKQPDTSDRSDLN